MTLGLKLMLKLKRPLNAERGYATDFARHAVAVVEAEN
jgi:hypothetical protein